jgi:membrane protein involved in colicin uptake
MISLQKTSRVALWAVILLLSFTACKSKKKAMEAAQAAEQARIEQEAAARKQKEADDQKRKDAEEKAAREAEVRAREEQKAKEAAPRSKIDQYFNAIANSGNVASANNTINEALSMFASPDTPVLIVISGSGAQKDYDKPTTIKDYLNYLKDQKKNINRIESMQFDSAGKVIELELRKN